MTPPEHGTLDTLLKELDLPQAPQQNRSRQKRDAIMRAAEELFSTRGFDATSMDDIAQAAHVSVGTVYRSFKDKRQLFLVLLEREVRAVLDLHISELDLTGDVRGATHGIVRRARALNESCSGLTRASLELMPRDPSVTAIHQHINRYVFEQVRALITRAREANLTWPDLDVDAMTLVLVQIFDPVGHAAPADRAALAVPAERVDAALGDMIYRALFKSSRDSA